MPLTRKLASKSLIKQNTNQDVFGTGVTNLVRDAFIGTGSQTVFNLTISPLSAANTQVFISGVYQNKDTYSISGNVLTFTSAPPNGTNIEVMSGTNYSIGVPGDGAVSNVKLAQAPAYTIKANNTATPSSPTDITVPQLAAMFTAPTIQRFTSGSGTYTTPANVKYIKIRMVGGGGGGGGGGSTGGGTGGNGGNTTFGSSLLIANGGNGGSFTVGGTGGTVTVNSPAIQICAFQGGDGTSGVAATIYVTPLTAGQAGAYTPFGGAGGGNYLSGGSNAISNTGSGGGSGSANGTVNGRSGGSGGAGGYIEAIINAPSSSYSWSIGSSGTAGSAGSNGYAGGAGGSGIIIVEEYYQ